jgi:hypothetical protein
MVSFAMKKRDRGVATGEKEGGGRRWRRRRRSSSVCRERVDLRPGKGN